MKKEQDETVIESAEELQRQIVELQSKAQKVETEAAETEAESLRVDMPLADVRIKLCKNGSDVPVRNVTPAELYFLVAEHHANAGGAPVVAIKPVGVIKRDPIYERGRLMARYSSAKVMALFPGTEPTFPKTFRRAIELGSQAVLPRETFQGVPALTRFEVAPMGQGD